jgi:pimeloyl-ACP methyl ester carboxylesterase
MSGKLRLFPAGATMSGFLARCGLFGLYSAGGLFSERNAPAQSYGWLVLGLGLFLSGCASMSGRQLTDTAEGKVGISEINTAAPVVVFESGLRSNMEAWNKVFPSIATTNTVFAYDRPGAGRSAPTTRARNGVNIVEDLRELLRSRNLRPPYVLVGHSAGGLYMQLYARRYPAEVAGLVLVDSTHPTQFEGNGSMQNRSTLTKIIFGVALTGTFKAEFDALSETGREVLAAPPARVDLPIVVLIAPDKSGTAMAAFDNAKRKDFARLYPNATVREVDSGHHIPQDKPQAVIDAIRNVLGAQAGRTDAAQP